MIEKIKIIAELIFVPLLIGVAAMTGVYILLFLLVAAFGNL